MRREPIPPIPQDIIEAIGHGPGNRSWPDDATMAFQQKIRARKEIDDGKWKSFAEIDDRTRTYAEWLESMSGVLTDDTLVRWMNYELMFAASAKKYLRELEMAKDCNQ